MKQDPSSSAVYHLPGFVRPKDRKRHNFGSLCFVLLYGKSRHVGCDPGTNPCLLSDVANFLYANSFRLQTQEHIGNTLTSSHLYIPISVISSPYRHDRRVQWMPSTSTPMYGFGVITSTTPLFLSLEICDVLVAKEGCISDLPDAECISKTSMSSMIHKELFRENR